MVKNYLGRCVYQVKGLNAERLLNECIKQDVELKLVDRCGDKMVIECPYTHHPKMLALLKNYDVISTEFVGLCSVLRLLKRRVSIIVGLVLACVLVAFWQTHLWHYSISGLQRVERAEIERFLGECGFGVGAVLSGLETEELSNQLLERFDQLSFVSVMQVGTTLVLNFKEKEYDENLDESLMLPLVASFDGVISSIEVSQGTALVKAGDVVKKGQVLIAPYVTINGEQKKVRAKGECNAQVFVKGQVVFNENETREVRSGNFIINRQIQMLGHTFNCLGEKIPYNAYEIEKNAKIVCKNMPLCFKIVEVRYYELIKVREQKKFAEERELLIRQSRYLAYKNLKKDFAVESEQTDVVIAGENYYITTYIKVNTNIGVYEEDES